MLSSQVLCADSNSQVLGFLPRELAQHLSPLMDNHDMIFKGSVTPVLRSSLHAVPVEITFEQTVLCEKGHDYQQVKCLWERALHAVGTSKTHVPSTEKYQQNFSLLLQEVLRSYSHLFTINEKIFLENFTTLPDDSQRLFVRLYTRKGPWFRMSNLSYSEILDCNEAAKGLDARGYICSVESVTDLQENDFKDLLNLLTVSELREIIYTLKKPTTSKDGIGENRNLYSDLFKS